MDQYFQTQEDLIEYKKEQAIKRRWLIKAGLVFLIAIVAAWYFGQWVAGRFL